MQADRRRHAGPLGVPADQGGQRPRRVVLRPHGVDRRGGAALGADDARLWLSAADGDASGFWFQSLLADLAFPSRSSGATSRPSARADAGAAQRYFASGGASPTRSSATPAPSSSGPAARWSTPGRPTPDDDEYDRVRTSNVETLLIGGELDFATPPQNATKELLPHLPNGHQVVLPGLGHTTDFWTTQPEAGTRLINTFLDSGRVDDSLYSPCDGRLHAGGHADRARQGHRAARWSASRSSRSLSLLLDGPPRAQARRLRAQGQRAAAVAVYPLVLGLGGWFLGALIVLHDDARRPARRRAARGALGRACRSASASTRLGAVATGRTDQDRRVRGGGRRCPRRCVARVPRARAPGPSHHDRRSDRRRKLFLLALDLSSATQVGSPRNRSIHMSAPTGLRAQGDPS